MSLKLSIDGTATGSASGASSGTMTITTANSNDLIYVVVGLNGTSQSVSSLSASGITFQTLARQVINNSSNCRLEVWYGTASSPLSSVTITVNFSASATAAFQAFGISGTNVGATGGYPYFDSNYLNGYVTSGSPPTNTGNSGSPLTTYTTNIPVAMLLAAVVETSNNAITVPSGFTQVQAKQNGSTSVALMVAYEAVVEPQSSVSATWTITSTQWATIGDSVIFATVRGSLINGIVNLGNNASYDIRPVLGEEWDVHNIAYGAAISLAYYDGTNTLTFDTGRTGAGVFSDLYFHVTNGTWLRITNNASGSAALYSFDGIQTSP